MTFKKIKLYTFKDNLKTITLNQYEHTVCKLCFELFCGDTPIDLTTFNEIRFYAQKPDGTVIGKVCTVEKNQAILAVPLQLTNVTGLAKCTVECSNVDGNVRFGGLNIYIIPSQDNEKVIESADEFTLLETTIAEAKKTISECVVTDEQLVTAVESYLNENPLPLLSEADRTDIARQVIEMLGGNPVFGYVDENNNVIVSGKLADGTYSVKYEMEDGTTLDIGDLILAESEPETEVVINQITISTDESGNLFNDGKGYKSGYRLSLSSGNESAEADYEVTGFIPVKYNDIIRIKNIDISQHDWINVVFYNADKTNLSTSGISGTQLYHMFVTNGTESDGVYEAKLSGDIHNSITSEVAYIRVGSQSITDESIITVNQEIV